MIVTGILVGKTNCDVVQQMNDNLEWVAPDRLLQNIVTQFGLDTGIGLLAQWYGAGRAFKRLAIGDTVSIKLDDGMIQNYIIREYREYVALTPTSATSDFVAADGRKLTSDSLFNETFAIYPLVLQTCDGWLHRKRLFWLGNLNE